MILTYLSKFFGRGDFLYVFSALLFSLRMKEERLQKKSEGASEVLAWVNRSRKIEEKKSYEKEKALQLSKIFEEQVSLFLW